MTGSAPPPGPFALMRAVTRAWKREPDARRRDRLAADWPELADAVEQLASFKDAPVAREARPKDSRFQTLAPDSHDTDDQAEVLCVQLQQVDKGAEARLVGYLQFRSATLDLLGDAPPAGVKIDDTGHGNPICFLLRHTIELALKIADPSTGHELMARLELLACRGAVAGMTAPPELVHLVRDFDHVDPNGEAFRYAAEGKAETCCVDPARLRRDLDMLHEAVTSFLWDLAPDPPSA